MRITIVKDDNFKTIGVSVETTMPGNFTPERVFEWGKWYAAGKNFAKTISGDCYEKEVFALVKADFELTQSNNLQSKIGDAILSAYPDGLPKDGVKIGGENFFKEAIDRAKANLDRKIEALENAIAERKKKN